MSQTTFTIDKSNLEVTMSRTFNATRERMWEVMSNPMTVPQWWGPKQFTTTVDKMDFKVGGEWRFVQKDTQGNEFGFHGVYLKIEPLQTISDTFNFEGIPPGHELVETAVLEELPGGQTRMTTTSKYANIEDLEGMVASGMEGGATETWERLAHMVENQ